MIGVGVHINITKKFEWHDSFFQFYRLAFKVCAPECFTC